MTSQSPTLDDPLAAGRDAIRRHAWQEAFEHLSKADAERELSAKDLESLGEAAWWIGRLDACIDARERAYAAREASGDRAGAAMIAMELAKDHYFKQAAAVGTAWLGRAQRLLEAEPLGPEHGWLERIQGVVAMEGPRDFDRALEHAVKAADIAARFGDRQLMAVALHDQGRTLVAKGEVSRGLELIDEATLAAVGGELDPFWTAVVYCNTISTCRDLADYRRAGEWSDAAKRWCERQTISGFPGMCRVYRAEIMRLRGAWADAEEEALRASDELRDFNVSYAAAAFYELGEIRLRAGDLDGAQQAFQQAHELGHQAQPGLALLHFARGDAEYALTAILRSLEELSPSDRLHRSRLLPAAVEIALAVGDIENARRAAAELEEIARDFGSTHLQAASETAWGAVALTELDGAEALQRLRRGWALWQEVEAPYEAARARELIGAALRMSGDAKGSGFELRAVGAAFERLGASLDARRVDEILGAQALRPSERTASRTFMFTDIVRSTNLLEAMGDDAWSDLMRWHDETLRALLLSHGGQEVDHTGDGFFAAFVEASAAVECAVAIQRSLSEHRRIHGFAPQVRIGLHAAAATRVGTGFRGKGVHEAARIGALAEGGEILASLPTVEAAGATGRVGERRQATLKGISGPVELATIAWR